VEDPELGYSDPTKSCSLWGEMPAFIHGEVNWSERVEVVTANVSSMTDAVAAYPWASTHIHQVSAHSPSCVLGVQDLFSQVSRGGEAVQQEVVVADIQLHGRADLVSRLDMSPSEGEISDAGLIARAYHRWGLEYASQISGEGAAAIWDPNSGRLICWRDPAGVRPLYYHHRPGRAFVFSSDLQSIAAHPGIPPHLDLEYANSFLRSELFQHPTRTLLDGVRKLPPGYHLIVDQNGVQTRRHWDPETIAERRNPEDRAVVEELIDLLRSAIVDRLGSRDHDVAAHLSGGLDSSSVALITAGLLNGGRRLEAFSWSPPRELVPAIERDERDLVEAAAGFGAIQPRYTRLSPADVVEVAYRDVALRPRATLNFEIATSKDVADSGARMIFSGWGGDEMIAFNGRGYFAYLARRGRLITVERELRLRSRIQGGTIRGAWKARVLMPLLPGSAFGGKPGERPPLPGELRPEFAHLLESLPPLEHDYPPERPGVHRMQAALFDFGHLQYRMESWAAHGASLGLVYTFPLLDRRIMELALSLPGPMFFRDGWKRWLYRTAMGGVLPDVVRWNPKKYDDAAGEHLRAVLREPADVYREPLLGHQDNPMVDVGVIISEQDRLREALSTDAHRRGATNPIGAGAWLAFTRLRPA